MHVSYDRRSRSHPRSRRVQAAHRPTDRPDRAHMGQREGHPGRHRLVQSTTWRARRASNWSPSASKLNAERAKVVRDMENAKHDYPARAAEALRAGDRAPADPTPKLTAKLEQLDKDLDVMRHALQQDADELEALVHANRETWHALNVDLRATAIAEAEDALAVLVGACDRLHRVRAQGNWLMGDKFTAPTLGSAELNKLADMIDKGRA